MDQAASTSLAPTSTPVLLMAPHRPVHEPARAVPAIQTAAAARMMPVVSTFFIMGMRHYLRAGRNGLYLCRVSKGYRIVKSGYTGY
jgi:hypothetical protein